MSCVISLTVANAPNNTCHCSCTMFCLFVLRFYSQVKTIGVMSCVISLPNHTFTGQTWSSKWLTSNVHILSPETDNLPFLNQRNGEWMTIENNSWSNLHERMLPARRGLTRNLLITTAHLEPLIVLRFYCPVNPLRSCQVRSVYLTKFFLGQTWSSEQLNISWAHSFARNWQLPFLNQQKGENNSRKYFMINLHERMLPNPAGIEPAIWSPVGQASD